MTLNYRTSLMSLVLVAALLPLTGADCDTNTTGPLFNPGGQSTSTTGPIAQAISGQPGPIPELSVGASATQVDPNQTFSFGASVSGGQSPYYYFWMRSDEAGWSQGGPTWTTRADFPQNQTRTMYCQVVDSNYVESNLVEITLSITAASTEPGCTTLTGASWTSNYGNITFTQNGNSLTGIVKNYSTTETITGTLTQGDGACANCLKFKGRWVGANNQGDVDFVFEPNRMVFSGGYTYDGSSWGGSWYGSRSDCN